MTGCTAAVRQDAPDLSGGGFLRVPKSYLRCESCLNIVGEAGETADGMPCVRISLKIRGARRRTYVVEGLSGVVCERCGHQGKPLPFVE